MYKVGSIARQTVVCPVSASSHLACLVSLSFPVPVFFFFFEVGRTRYPFTCKSLDGESSGYLCSHGL